MWTLDPRIIPLKKPGISSTWMGSPWLSLAISADFSLVGGLECSEHVLFSISFMGCHPSHWRTHMFQDGEIAPPTSIIIYIMSVWLPFTCHRNCRNISTSHAYPPLQVPAGGWTQILLYMGWCEVSRGPGAPGATRATIQYTLWWTNIAMENHHFLGKSTINGHFQLLC